MIFIIVCSVKIEVDVGDEGENVSWALPFQPVLAHHPPSITGGQSGGRGSEGSLALTPCRPPPCTHPLNTRPGSTQRGGSGRSVGGASEGKVWMRHVDSITIV